MSQVVQDLVGYRVLAVHAHPDDESLFTGGTLADFAARGAKAHVITATLGELGEVIGTPRADLAGTPALAGWRARELADACAALGATWELLGGASNFRDSGMADMVEAQSHPQALVNRVDEAAQLLSKRIEEINPDIIVTYGPDGGYGHPDHIAVHTAVHKAAQLCQERTDCAPYRIWWAIFAREPHFEAASTIVPPRGWTLPPAGYEENFTTPGSSVRYPLDATAYAAKRAAMAAHPTQIWLGDGTISSTNPRAAYASIHVPEVAPVAYALSNLFVMPLLPAEYYQPGQGCPDIAQLDEGCRGAQALLLGLLPRNQHRTLWL